MAGRDLQRALIAAAHVGTRVQSALQVAEFNHLLCVVALFAGGQLSGPGLNPAQISMVLLPVARVVPAPLPVEMRDPFRTAGAQQLQRGP